MKLGRCPEQITINQLAQGSEHVEGHEVRVTPSVAREVIQTGLFTGRPGATYGPARLDVAEFLAARYPRPKQS